ncbi:MAG TPA: hypothetical protein VFH51_06315, partial [Myxococcota bacterium]|nr:hypothetical protein [Myxococcota bacterium]
GSRTFLGDRLSLGATLNLGVAKEVIELPQFDDFAEAHQAYAVGGTFGMMLQLPLRVLVGTAFTLPMRYRFGAAPSLLPGFVQPLDVPQRYEVGVGWIPNRYLRGSAQVSLIDATPGAALLSDDARRVGQRATLQPKIGAAYTFMDYRNWKGTFFGGSYYEVSRTDGAPDRLHATLGVELKAWLITAGLGLDAASNYRNLLVSVGADLGFVLQRLRIVPIARQPPRMGMFPDPLELSDAGLPRALVQNWRPAGPDMDLMRILQNVPENTQRSLERLGKDFDAPEEVPDPQP